MTSSPASGVTLADLAAHTGARLEGEGSIVIERVATLEHAGPATISFLANPRYRAQLATTQAAAVVVAPGDAAATRLPKLVSDNPYVTFAKIASRLHPRPPHAPGVHSTACVDPSAQVSASASIGPFAVIGAGASVGERASIGSHCAVGAHCSVAEDVVLHPHVTLYARSVVGPRTLIHAGAVIGADGFGMAEEGGRWLKIPQVGRVVIGADVEIGANTSIDRGAIDDTIIGDDVKLDNLIQVGHNCVIGAHTAIAGCAGLAGSVRVGRNCKIGGAAMISGHLEIPDGTVISGGTTVYDSIRAPDVYTSIFPALPHRAWRHVAIQLRRLRELAERVAALERASKSAPDDK
jgi:UDP-3-O-[3-hydroxymyristoyl] glucosamine N-acyltransferase